MLTLTVPLAARWACRTQAWAWLSTSATPLGSNKEWVRMKRAEEQRRLDAWREKRKGNPFARNVGMARVLRQSKV